MREEDDWRLTNQQSYLRGASLRWKIYTRYSDTWEHDHCEFCWEKFMDKDYPEALRAGYATEDDYHWICEQCFEDFKDLFEWNIVQTK